MKKIILLILFITASFFTIDAQYTKLLDFAGASNGSHPYGSLVSDGTFLYGMTIAGGTNDLGTIFKIRPDGTGYSKLLDFAGNTNGNIPWGSLLYDGVFLYGMTSHGGAHNDGTIFKIMPDGTGYFKLLDFSDSITGGQPFGSLISDGTFLFGMTSIGGGTNTYGVLFKILLNGTGYEHVLDFTVIPSGNFPAGSLMSDGTYLYGMTPDGGGANNDGIIFKIMPNGMGYLKLLDFTDSLNGAKPYGNLISDGTFLYGMTYSGGLNDSGTIFKIMPDGTGYSKLLDFDGANGNSPQQDGSLIFDGTFLYGMTSRGGTNSLGVIFKIKTDGAGFSKLLDFAGASNGSYPFGSLISEGNILYGMTPYGGTNNLGTIFKLSLATATEEINQQPLIVVSPNPFNNFIAITGIKVKCEAILFDITGKEILRQNISNGEIKINTDNIAKGIYLLHYNDEKTSANYKVVKL